MIDDLFAWEARAKTPSQVAIHYLDRLAATMRLVPLEPLQQAIGVLLEAREAGRRVYVMGNGGSAAIASQFVCNFVKTVQTAGQRPLKAFALTDNLPSVSAWANDNGYDRIFSEQIKALADPDDVVIVITGKGMSPNIIAALRAAREVGATSIGLLGFDGGDALRLVDIPILIPSDDYGLVEDTYMGIGHSLVRALQAPSSISSGIRQPAMAAVPPV
jgi:D-sedoheptulose 7-phosphate isomerase